MRSSIFIPLSAFGRAAGGRGRGEIAAMRKAMRRAAARRRLAVVLRRKPFGRVARSLNSQILALEDTAPSAGRAFAWRKRGAQ